MCAALGFKELPVPTPPMPPLAFLPSVPVGGDTRRHDFSPDVQQVGGPRPESVPRWSSGHKNFTVATLTDNEAAGQVRLVQT